MRPTRSLFASAVLMLVLATLLAGTTSAITLTQAEAPIPVPSAAPGAIDGDGATGGGDVADLDTKEPTEAVTTNNVVLLIAALGVLVGVLIVTRRKSGPGT